jgi:hypothetical protein
MSSGKDQGTTPLRGTPSITPEDGIKLLSMQIDKGKGFDVTFDEDAFRSWDNTTRNYVEKAFGENHRNVINFEAIRFTCNAPRPHFAFLSLDYFRTFQGKITALKGYVEELETDIRLRPSSVSIHSSASPGVSKRSLSFTVTMAS